MFLFLFWKLASSRYDKIKLSKRLVQVIVHNFGCKFLQSFLKASLFEFQEKEKTNSGYKHNNKFSHGIFNLTFRMLQHTSSEVTVTKYDEI